MEKAIGEVERLVRCSRALGSEKGLSKLWGKLRPPRPTNLIRMRKSLVDTPHLGWRPVMNAFRIWQAARYDNVMMSNERLTKFGISELPCVWEKDDSV